jgi:hypothetical protein
MFASMPGALLAFLIPIGILVITLTIATWRNNRDPAVNQIKNGVFRPIQDPQGSPADNLITAHPK